MNHRRGSTRIYNGCGDSFSGVHPSMQHRRGLQSFIEFSRHINASLWGLYSHLPGLPCITEGSRPLDESSQGIQTHVQGLQ